MEPQTLLNVGLTLASSALGWFARVLYQATQELRRDLNALHIELARDYVPTRRFEDATKAINEKLDTIIRTLGEKANRHD